LEHDDESEGDHGWVLGDKAVTAALASTDFYLWQDYRKGRLPSQGGWLDQQLDLMTRIQVMDLVFETKRAMLAEGFDWSKLTALQVDLMKWIEAEK
jgi:hypothetical protein